jgi:hypothetical protein
MFTERNELLKTNILFKNVQLGRFKERLSVSTNEGPTGVTPTHSKKSMKWRPFVVEKLIMNKLLERH